MKFNLLRSHRRRQKPVECVFPSSGLADGELTAHLLWNRAKYSAGENRKSRPDPLPCPHERGNVSHSN
jgi:hypothetical protein